MVWRSWDVSGAIFVWFVEVGEGLSVVRRVKVVRLLSDVRYRVTD